jgi:hypothetical protein
MNILSVLLPILVAALTTLGFEYLQKAITLVDALPDVVKRLIVGAVSFGLTALAAALGVHLSSSDPTALQSGDLSALIAAGLSYVFHLSGQTQAVAVATNATPVKP